LPEILRISQVEFKEIQTVGSSMKIISACGEKCPRSWKWVDHLVDAGCFGEASQKCFGAFNEKYTESKK
jgi:hypothetical protein